MVGAQDTGVIAEDLLEHGDGFVEPSHVPAGDGEVVA